MRPCSTPGCKASTTHESFNYCRFHGTIEAQMQRDWWIDECIDRKMSMETTPCPLDNNDWRARVVSEAAQQQPSRSLVDDFKLGHPYRQPPKTMTHHKGSVVHHEHGLHEVEFNRALVELSADLKKALARLPPRHEFAMRLRFGLSGVVVTEAEVPSYLDLDDEMTLEEVGIQLGVSRERVRHIEAEILRLLQKNKQLKQHLTSWQP